MAVKKEIKKKANIGVVQLSTYTSPVIKEVRGKDWVDYGEDNNYYGYLQDRINGSPTNNAIVNAMIQAIYGRGLSALDSEENPEQFTEAMMLLTEETVVRATSDLKSMGQCALQVVYSLDKKFIRECNHFPVETLRMGVANEDGEIEHVYYSKDWQDLYRNSPVPFACFGTSDDLEEILIIKPYKTGFYYYSPVDYQGGLQYCELEEEIGNYHLNNILNGLAPSMLINFNNGVPTETEQRAIERDIFKKFGGSSNAGRFITSFNDNKETETTITPVQLSDADKQYQFLSDECLRKIMVAHRVISPMLFGIKDTTGFGNNAEELKTASILSDNTVIRPFQDLLIAGFNKVLSYNNISLKLYFKTLQPLEFTDLENAITSDAKEEETGQKFSSQKELSKEMADTILSSLQGETITDDWMLIDIRPATSLERYFNDDLKTKLASAINSTADQESVQDSVLFKVRYKYVGEVPAEREFCQKMLSANQVYRYEDLDKEASNNAGFGIAGADSYNLFLYKGGVNCKHWWMRQIYFQKTDQEISVNEARRIIIDMLPNMREEFKFPVNPPEVAQIASEYNDFWRYNKD